VTGWTHGDDLIVGISYIQYGVNVTPELKAELPDHEDGSIRMRLQNFQYLATQGEEGLSNAAESTKDAYRALLPALLFQGVVNAMIDSGFTPHEMGAQLMLPEAQAGFLSEYISQRLKVAAAQH